MNKETTHNLDDASLYINRELSWLDFNKRVMELAEDENTPLLERLRYLCICSSNLDEFYEVRVAGLEQQLALYATQCGPDQMSAQEQLQKIDVAAHKLVERQYHILNECILPDLAKHNIHFLRRGNWNSKQRAWAKKYFVEQVIPVVSPLGLDSAHPFPRLLSKSLNFIINMDGVDPFGRDINVALLQAPRVLPRIIRLPAEVANGDYDFVFLSSIIHDFVGELFPGMKITGFHQFRVTRNTDLFLNEEEVEDLLSAIKGELPQRNFGQAVRLEVADTCPAKTVDYLLNKFNLGRSNLFQVKGPVNLSRLSGVLDSIERSDLLFPSFVQGLPKQLSKDANLFDVVKQNDVFLHHPYHSFAPVVDFIKQAAADPNVLAIKQTVYRAGTSSPIEDALMEAALAGKEVTVVVELRARFDEETNVKLADKLHMAGCQVVYGMVGYKTHAKMLMIVRKEGEKIVRYVHLGTGNYHAGTARIYTDYGLMSANPKLCEDVHKVFNQITGVGQVGDFKKILVSPNNLFSSMIEKIDREIAHAKAGKKARIAARMNAIIEPKVIKKLYQASQAGVKIDLVVRGMCSLRPQVKGVSENIRLRTVLGRFLEHSRVYYFYNQGASEMYLSSADWMPRNLFRRVEVAFAVEDKVQQATILEESIDNFFKENQRAWDLQANGDYKRVTAGKQQPFSAQQYLMQKLGG